LPEDGDGGKRVIHFLEPRRRPLAAAVEKRDVDVRDPTSPAFRAAQEAQAVRRGIVVKKAEAAHLARSVVKESDMSVLNFTKASEVNEAFHNAIELKKRQGKDSKTAADEAAAEHPDWVQRLHDLSSGVVRSAPVEGGAIAEVMKGAKLIVAKSNGTVTQAAAIGQFLAAHPDLYQRYTAEVLHDDGGGARVNTNVAKGIAIQCPQCSEPLPTRYARGATELPNYCGECGTKLSLSGGSDAA
jgi:hypothetical protein